MNNKNLKSYSVITILKKCLYLNDIIRIIEFILNINCLSDNILFPNLYYLNNRELKTIIQRFFILDNFIADKDLLRNIHINIKNEIEKNKKNIECLLKKEFNFNIIKKIILFEREKLYRFIKKNKNYKEYLCYTNFMIYIDNLKFNNFIIFYKIISYIIFKKILIFFRLWIDQVGIRILKKL